MRELNIHLELRIGYNSFIKKRYNKAPCESLAKILYRVSSTPPPYFF